MSEPFSQKRGRGRPRKEPPAFDPDVTKEFIDRLFTIEREVKVLQEDKKQLKEEFKDKINQKLIAKIVRLVKLKVSLEEEGASPDTLSEVEELVLDKISMIVG
jgi:uncharacterized protein (UPF0335 family)